MDSAGPLSWGVSAKISADATHLNSSNLRRPGTSNFRPGARVWVLPVVWGDGGDQRIVVGPQRYGSGRSWVMSVVPDNALVRFRVQGIYSPSMIKRMKRADDDFVIFDKDYSPSLWGSKIEAEQHVLMRQSEATFSFCNWRTGIDPQHVVHRTDEDCKLCEGRDAFFIGHKLDVNPYPSLEEPRFTPTYLGLLSPEQRAFYELSATAKWRWDLGWYVGAALSGAEAEIDEPLEPILEHCRRRYKDAHILAREIKGLTQDEAFAFRNDHQLDVPKFRWVLEPTTPSKIEGTVTAMLADNVITSAAGSTFCFPND